MLETIGNALRADQSKLIGQESGRRRRANHPDGAPYRTAWMSTLTAADPIQRPDARAVLFKGGINGSAAERAITTTPALPTAAGLGWIAADTIQGPSAREVSSWGPQR